MQFHGTQPLHYKGTALCSLMLKRMGIFSGEVTLAKLFCFTSEKESVLNGSTVKGKNLLP